MIRRLFKIVIVLIVLIIAAVIFGFTRIDAIAKAAVERGSTYALGVNTTVKGAKVKIFDGQFVMQGLNVANPQGYKTDHFLTLGKSDVAVTLTSLRKEVIDLPHLKLNSVDVNLEKQAGKANYQVILDNLKKLESGSKPAEPGHETRFRIKKLTIKDAAVHADTISIAGTSAPRIDVPLGDITLKNVGDDKGVTMGELTSLVTKAILAATISKAGDLLPKDLLGDLSGQLSQLKDIRSLSDIEKLGDLGGVGEKVKEGVSKSIGNLGGLLNKDDKNKK